MSALCRLANKLRGDNTCICDSSQVPAYGSFNWTILLLFNDGVEWILRSPRNDGAITSDETNRSLLASEAATLKYIKANSTIPVPEVFAYSCSKNNDVGIPYILMSKARGTPLEHAWRNLDISQDHKAKTVFQLGILTEQLNRLCFDRAGSLFEEDGEFHIKTCLSRGLLLHGRHTLQDLPRGPFELEKDYYQAQFSAFFEHVKYLPLAHHCFMAPVPTPSEYGDSSSTFQEASTWWSDFVTLQSKIDSSDNRADYVVAGEILVETMQHWVDGTSTLPFVGRKDRFVLHYPNLSVGNVYIDADFNITCVIDWAFCSAVPLSMLLMAPGLPQLRYELDTSLVSAFENGFRHALTRNNQHLAINDKDLLCEMLSRSRPLWLLSRILSFDCTTDYHLFKALWSLTSHRRDMLEYFRSKRLSTKYMTLWRELKEDDQTSEQVATQERDYFRSNILRLAVARKLTLVSQWSMQYQAPQSHGIRSSGDIFVADKKLWAWIDDCLKS